MSVYFITCDIYIKGKFCNKVLMQFAYKDKVKASKEIITKALFNKNTDTSIGELEKEDD